MSEIPNIWRTELWHPMIVHFPIVLLMGATVLRLLSKLITSRQSDFFIKTSRLCLIIGVPAVWVAIYSGLLADSIVVRTLCDPISLEKHENGAYLVGFIFTLAAALDGVKYFLERRKKDLFKNLIEWSLIIMMLFGTVYMSYVAHLGASLVYQQGAGVYHPTAGCSEFE